MASTQLTTDFAPGTVARVFDAVMWGGKDVGDNQQFWQRAAILSRYHNDRGEDLATVRFFHDGRISRGHFVKALRDA